ncbi:dTMP kinase [Pseudoalteromonas sp. MM17-2]|uniref:dTMP kinase n=1 Tax=Pseudoalteromonas sp. MM17-2 TaxID=2917753 RepID=UPI001EF424F3|nr:dTMP kinase [Pseudoalteromonas sp. MM17-2]MCG7542858.1 dTMP kinase [Pseudoalteromonas sp. MM17-2]
MTAKFIVIEGLEGSGKSTAMKICADTLSRANIDYITTREPGGTPVAEQLRTIVKHAEKESISTQTELLLMYAARSQLLENVIRPALASGQWVLGDRHDLSSQAYQGGGRQISYEVMNFLSQYVLAGTRPDLTVYLDIEPALGLARARGRGELDRIEREDLSFFERTRARYLELAEQDERIVVIDASQAIEKVHQDIEQTLCEFIARR